MICFPNKKLPQSRKLKELEMNFPLGFTEISLWLAVTSIILWVTSELIMPLFGSPKVLINNKTLRRIALSTTVLFLVTVAILTIQILIDLRARTGS